MQVQLPTKPATSSLTIWFNAGTILIVALGALADNALALHIPPVVLAWIAVISGVVNTLLRMYKTALPIGPEGGSKTVTVDPPTTIG